MSYYTGYEHGRTPDDCLDYYNYNTTSSYDATSPTSSGGTSMPASSLTYVFGPSTSGSYSTPTGHYPIPSENYLFPRGSSPEGGRTNAELPVLGRLHVGCEYQTKRQSDLDRHQKRHFPSAPPEKIDCPGRGCGRTGEHGFIKKEHFTVHLRKVHAKDIPESSRPGGESRH